MLKHNLYFEIMYMEMQLIVIRFLCTIFCSYWRRFLRVKHQKMHPPLSVFFRHCNRSVIAFHFSSNLLIYASMPFPPFRSCSEWVLCYLSIWASSGLLIKCCLYVYCFCYLAVLGEEDHAIIILWEVCGSWEVMYLIGPEQYHVGLWNEFLEMIVWQVTSVNL